MSDVIVKEIETKSPLTKTNVPLGGWCFNPYVGCTHKCAYCYACFMKRFTGHGEEWGTFLDVKKWPRLKNPEKYRGQRIVFGTVTDCYLPQEEEYRRTRALLEELSGAGAKITICTKSDLVLRDLDLLKRMGDVTISWSVNTLDEAFKDDMDSAVSIGRRLEAMRICHEEGFRTVCFTAPIFPGITDVFQIFERVKDAADFVWLENLNLRGGFRERILSYIEGERPDLVPLYDEIYKKGSREYWKNLEKSVAVWTAEHGWPFIDNYLPDGRSEKGKPAVINYLYHEEVRGSENTGRR